VAHPGHLSNATGIVTDRTVSINGKTSRNCAQHAESSHGNSIHRGNGETDVDANSNSEDGDYDGLVSQSKAEYDIGGGTSSAGIGDILHRAAA
jgi:hypothetical protein